MCQDIYINWPERQGVGSVQVLKQLCISNHTSILKKKELYIAAVCGQ